MVAYPWLTRGLLVLVNKPWLTCRLAVAYPSMKYKQGATNMELSARHSKASKTSRQFHRIIQLNCPRKLEGPEKSRCKPRIPIPTSQSP